MKNFKNYLETKKKLVATYDGPFKDKPQGKRTDPYHSYKRKVKCKYGNKAVTVEEFVEKTKELSNSEFLKYIGKETNKEKLKIETSLNKILKKSKKENYILETIIQELQKNNLLESFTKKLIKNYEAKKIITESISSSIGFDDEDFEGKYIPRNNSDDFRDDDSDDDFRDDDSDDFRDDDSDDFRDDDSDDFRDDDDSDDFRDDLDDDDLDDDDLDDDDLDDDGKMKKTNHEEGFHDFDRNEPNEEDY